MHNFFPLNGAIALSEDPHCIRMAIQYVPPKSKEAQKKYFTK